MNRYVFASILAALVWACGGADANPDGDVASESGAGNEVKAGASKTPAPARSTAQDEIAKCDGHPGCVNGVVVALLEKSSLVLTGTDRGKTIKAHTYVSEFLAAPTIAGATREMMVRTTAEGRALKVNVNLFDADETGESSVSFEFTLNGDTITESTVEAMLAG